MKRSLPLISYLFVLFWLWVPWTAQAEVLVEAVIAVLNFESGTPQRKVIYFSDLERHRLFFEGPKNAKIDAQDDRANNKTSAFKRRRDAVIHQTLFLREALRFAIKKPGEQEVLAALQNIRQRFQTEAYFENALQKSALSLPELEEEIALHLWVGKLLQERIQAFIFISPKAIELYQLNHLNAFIGEPIETIEKKITKILSHQKEIEKKQVYLKRLKEKVGIEFILSELEISKTP